MEQPLWWKDRKQRCKELAVVALSAAVVSLVLSCSGFATNDWTVVTVDRVKLKVRAIAALDTTYLLTLHTNYNYFDRKRGLFQICFPDNNETEFLKKDDFYKGGKCLHETGMRPSKEKTSWGSDYKQRNVMVRTHVALLGMGIGFLFLSFISGSASCSTLSSRVLLVSSVCSLIAFFSGFSGMIIYHIYDDNETYNLNYKPFKFYWSKDLALRSYSSVNYGYSFFLAWIGVAMNLVVTVLFWGAYVTWKGYIRKNKHRSLQGRRLHQDNPYYHIKRPRKQHNRKYDDFNAYKYMQRPRKNNYRSEYSRGLTSPGDNLRDFYLQSGEPSFASSDRRMFPLSSRMAPSYKPYDYYDYYNIYGSGGIYPY